VGHALAYLGPKDKKIAAKLVELWRNVQGDHGGSWRIMAGCFVMVCG